MSAKFVATFFTLLSLLAWLVAACASTASAPSPQSSATPTVVDATATAVPPTASPTPVIVASATPTDVPPTATAVPATEIPASSATPDVAPTLPAPTPIDAGGAQLEIKAWSPSGRYVSYLRTARDESETLLIYDTVSGTRCELPDQVQDWFLPTHLWLENDALLFKRGQGEFFQWETPCDGDPTPITGDVPTLLYGVASSSDHSRWLVLSEDDLWLFDAADSTFTPVTGMRYGTHPSAGWSPDGETVVVVYEGSAFAINADDAEAVRVASWEYIESGGGENFPGAAIQWLDATHFVTAGHGLSGAYRIGLDGTMENLSQTLFGISFPPPNEGQGAVRLWVLPSATLNDAAWHLLHAQYGDGRGPAFQLYHHESELVESIELPTEDAILNFVGAAQDGSQLLFEEWENGATGRAWLYAVEGDGSERWVEAASANLSPDGNLLALSRENGVYVERLTGDVVAEWPLTFDRNFAELGWSPDSRHLVVSGQSEGEPQLFILPIRSQ